MVCPHCQAEGSLQRTGGADDRDNQFYVCQVCSGAVVIDNRTGRIVRKVPPVRSDRR